jgi:hypothetical protein
VADLVGRSQDGLDVVAARGLPLENWLSEILAVGSMAVMAIYLRQRGSPEAKPVGAPHHAKGV